MINAMNTSAITNQTHHITTNTAHATGIGFQRRCMASALLAAAITATAVGLAATSHADDGAPAPNTEVTVAVPAPAAPWLPTIDRFVGCWRQWFYFNGSWHCG
jgi:hypothetical protein